MNYQNKTFSEPKGKRSPDQIIEQSMGKDAVKTLNGVRGPENPTLVEAGRWEFAAGVIGLMFQSMDDVVIIGGSSPRPGLKNIARAKGLDGKTLSPEDELAQMAEAARGEFAPDGSPKQEGPKRPGAPGHLGEQAELVSTSVYPGKSGKVVMAARSATEAALQQAAGAPTVVFWSEPKTEICHYAVVGKAVADNIRDNAFSCDIASPHGDGAIIRSFEDAKLGSSSGPAVQFVNPVGAASAPPVFCLEGSRVSPDEHAIGRAHPFSGSALAAALIAGAENKPGDGFGFPGGKTVCNIDGMSNELARAQQLVRGWLSGREPAARNKERDGAMAETETRMKKAEQDIEAAQARLASLKASGASAVTVDFGGFPLDPDHFSEQLAASVRTQNDLVQAEAIKAQSGKELNAGPTPPSPA